MVLSKRQLLWIVGLGLGVAVLLLLFYSLKQASRGPGFRPYDLPIGFFSPMLISLVAGVISHCAIRNYFVATQVAAFVTLGIMVPVSFIIFAEGALIVSLFLSVIWSVIPALVGIPFLKNRTSTTV